MSEWCSKAPTLEEDIAMSNISLDMFGQANGFYQYAAQLNGFKSADELAFKRNEREFFNHQLVEQKNGNFGNTQNFNDKYFRETFFASVHTRNLAKHVAISEQTGTSISQSSTYNK